MSEEDVKEVMIMIEEFGRMNFDHALELTTNNCVVRSNPALFEKLHKIESRLMGFVE